MKSSIVNFFKLEEIIATAWTCGSAIVKLKNLKNTNILRFGVTFDYDIGSIYYMEQVKRKDYLNSVVYIKSELLEKCMRQDPIDEVVISDLVKDIVQNTRYLLSKDSHVGFYI